MKSKFVFAAAFLAVAFVVPMAHAQVSAPVFQSATSPDGLLSVFLTSSNPSDTAGVNNTYTWTAVNNSATTTLIGVTLGSHWGDWCGGSCTPPGPTLISAPGCAGQGPAEIPNDAHFGVWCTPTTGVTLLPGETITGSVTLRPGAGGPPDYTVYSLYNDPTGGNNGLPLRLSVTHNNVVNPAATDIQIKGAASTGSPAVGSSFTYTFEVKNAGPWGTYGGIVFSDPLPQSLTYVSASISPLSARATLPACNLVGQTVVCALNELQNGSAATITLSVTASSTPQQIVNTASALTVSPQTDSNIANNGVSVTVTSK